MFIWFLLEEQYLLDKMLGWAVPSARVLFEAAVKGTRCGSREVIALIILMV